LNNINFLGELPSLNIRPADIASIISTDRYAVPQPLPSILTADDSFEAYFLAADVYNNEVVLTEQYPLNI